MAAWPPLHGGGEWTQRMLSPSVPEGCHLGSMRREEEEDEDEVEPGELSAG